MTLPSDWGAVPVTVVAEICEEGLIGSTDLPVIRQEQQDDGTITAIVAWGDTLQRLSPPSAEPPQGELLKRHFPKKPSIGELWDAVARALDDAGKALPVLMTMLKHAHDDRGKGLNLRQGAMVADEMLGQLKYAQQALPVLRAQPAAAPQADVLPLSVAARAFLISRFDQYVSDGDCRALEKLIGDYAQPQQPSPSPSVVKEQPCLICGGYHGDLPCPQTIPTC